MKFLWVTFFFTSLASAQVELSFTQVKPEAEYGTYYRTSSGLNFLVSKEKFKSQEEAKNFCALHLMPMASGMDLLGLSMTVDLVDTAIYEASSFELVKPAEGNLTLLWDSEAKASGTDMLMSAGGDGSDFFSPISYAQVAPVLDLNGITGVAAICGSITVNTRLDSKVNVSDTSLEKNVSSLSESKLEAGAASK